MSDKIKSISTIALKTGIKQDELEEGEFIRSFGIDYKIETVKDLNKFKSKMSKVAGY